MSRKSTKTIRIKLETYNSLAKLGDLADSFDSVIHCLLVSRSKDGGAVPGV